MTLDSALKPFQHNKSVSHDLVKVVQQLAENESHQFYQKANPTGYSVIAAACATLNAMWEEIGGNYDTETQHCEIFFNYRNVTCIGWKWSGGVA